MRITKKSKTERTLVLLFYIIFGFIIQLMNTTCDFYFLFLNLYKEESDLVLREE